MDRIDSAIILVGQKNLSKININREFLKDSVEKLINLGFENIVLSTNSFLDEYEKFCLESQFKPNTVRVIKERETLGSGGAIKNVMLSLNIESSLVLFSNSKIDFDLDDVLEKHLHGKEKNSLLVSDNNELLNLKKESIKARNDVFLVDIEIFNHTHLNKFSFVKELLPLTFKDEFNYITL